MELLLKSEKLFQVIRDIKKRLAMIEKPSINCGWGDEDAKILDELVKQQGKEPEKSEEFINPNESEQIRVS